MATERTRGAAAHDGAPPPAVVLHGELEVREGHRDECRHDDQDDEHDEQNTVDGVHLRMTLHESIRRISNVSAQSCETLSLVEESMNDMSGKMTTACLTGRSRQVIAGTHDLFTACGMDASSQKHDVASNARDQQHMATLQNSMIRDRTGRRRSIEIQQSPCGPRRWRRCSTARCRWR